MRFLFALVASACIVGCGSNGDHANSGDGGTDGPVQESVEVQIGLPAGSDGLGFAPLEPGGELRLQTFGQGGTHVLLGVRCIGFGNRAFVKIALRNLATEAEAITNPPVRPQLLYCRDERTCDLVPLLAMTSGLTEPGAERNGVRISVTASVHNEAGLAAETTQEAVLSTADL